MKTKDRGKENGAILFGQTIAKPYFCSARVLMTVGMSCFIGLWMGGLQTASHAADLTLESAATLNTMESPISRWGSMNYESAVGWRRDSNFNLQQTTQPGWMTISASAIGNLVNVQMSGAGNTVVVNAMQMNSGNQQATIALGNTVDQAKNTSADTNIYQKAASTGVTTQESDKGTRKP